MSSTAKFLVCFIKVSAEAVCVCIVFSEAEPSVCGWLDISLLWHTNCIRRLLWNVVVIKYIHEMNVIMMRKAWAMGRG